MRGIAWSIRLGLSALLIWVAAAQASAETNIMFILDASNSMWGQIEGVSKIETARGVLGGLLADIGGQTSVGLMAYGHRSEGACDDVEVISPLGAQDAAQLVEALNKIQPTGKTPIAGALESAGAAFSAAGANNNIVLISDGVETCDGDPCAVAEKLAQAGINTRIHVVGFDIGGEDGKQLQCIAEKGNGKYFSASNANELQSALAEARELAEAAPEPTPEPAPAPEIVFEDSFDGDDLTEQWSVLSPNPDAFIVENGALLLIAQATGGLETAEHPNVFRLDFELPKGDWTLTAILNPEIQTGQEFFQLGLYGGEGNAIAAKFAPRTALCCVGSSKYSVSFLSIEKLAGGEKTHFTREADSRVATRDKSFGDYGAALGRPIHLQLVKQGRKYQARLYFQGNDDEEGKAQWVESEFLTSLRAPKQVALTAGQDKAVSGESLWLIESVSIEKN